MSDTLTQEAGQIEVSGMPSLDAEIVCNWEHGDGLNAVGALFMALDNVVWTPGCTITAVARVVAVRCDPEGSARLVCENARVVLAQVVTHGHLICYKCEDLGYKDPQIENCWKLVDL